MLTDEYIELVRLTKDYLLQSIPKKTAYVSLVAAHLPLPHSQELQPLPKPKEMAEVPPAPIPVPKKEEALSAEPVYQEVNDILELLKVHCPKLKLVNPPTNRKTVFILFAQETTQEKTLLENIAKGIRKEGYLSELLEAHLISEAHIQMHSTILLGARSTFASQTLLKQHAKRHPTGKLYIDKAEALVIPSLENLIQEPAQKRTLWSDILAILKS
jgi:hypothetical protein